jgi:hypothetical protein
MVELITKHFTDTLPTVPDTYAAEFAQGMLKYFESYKGHRDSSINFDQDPDYLAERYCIMALPEDQFWFHSPAFRKTAAKAIQELFKTTIIGLGGDLVRLNPSIFFADKPGHVWNFSIEGNRLYAKFPYILLNRFHICTKLTFEELKDKQDMKILLQSVDEWNDRSK